MWSPRLQPGGPEQVGEPVRALLELPVGERPAVVHDDGGLVGRGLGEGSGVHRARTVAACLVACVTVDPTARFAELVGRPGRRCCRSTRPCCSSPPTTTPSTSPRSCAAPRRARRPRARRRPSTRVRRRCSSTTRASPATPTTTTTPTTRSSTGCSTAGGACRSCCRSSPPRSAARAGVCLAPVGMPGHFLLRDCADPDGFVDPFHGGALLDRAGCVAIFRPPPPGAPPPRRLPRPRRRRGRAHPGRHQPRAHLPPARPGHARWRGPCTCGPSSSAATPGCTPPAAGAHRRLAPARAEAWDQVGAPARRARPRPSSPGAVRWPARAPAAN